MLQAPTPPPNPYIAPAGRVAPSTIAAPGAVWLVALALFGLGIVVLIPFFQSIDVVGKLFNSNYRYFAALTLYVLVLLVGIAMAFFALGVGLLKGNRVAQLLTCCFSGLIGFSLVIDASSSEGTSTLSTGWGVVTLVVAIAVIGLLALAPSAKEFFAQDNDRPFGVLVATSVAVYFGAVFAAMGCLMFIVGKVDGKFYGIGVGLLVAGVVLLGSGPGLRAGRNAWRMLVSLAFVALVILQFVQMSSSRLGGGASVGALLPIGLSLIALGGLWFSSSSQHHFANPRAQEPLTLAAKAGLAAVALFALIGIVLGATGASY
jgi:hypothetical protein